MITNALHAIASGVSYLLRARWSGGDQAYTDAQVLNTTAEGVEDGSLTLTIVDGGLATVGNKMEVTPQSTPAVADQGFLSPQLTRSIGLGAFVTINIDDPYAENASFYFNSASVITSSSSNGFYFIADAIKVMVTGTNIVVITVTHGLDIGCCLILGGYDVNGTPFKTGDTKANFKYGASYYIKPNASSWTLIWRSPANNYNPYLGSMMYAYSGTMDNIIIPDPSDGGDLSANQATNNLSTIVTTADTFIHIADCVIESVVTTLPSSGNYDIEFRRQDDSNKWICRTTSAGAISLVEVVATVETTRTGPVAAAVANGQRIVITTDDTDIIVYANAIKRGSYTSAVNFKTNTGGKVVFSSGAIAYIADWARGTGSEYSNLDNY